MTTADPSQPPVPSPVPVWPQAGARALKGLGRREDGWSDLIDGYAEQAQAITTLFRTKVATRDHPRSGRQAATLTIGSLDTQRRSHDLITTSGGATIAVHVGPFGRDLYLRWDLYVRPVVNWRMVRLLAVLALMFSTPLICVALGFGVSAGSAGESFAAVLFGLFVWASATVTHFILLAIPVIVVGFFIQGNPLAYFFKQVNAFDLFDIEATTKGVHRSLMETIEISGIEAKLREKEQFYAEAERQRRRGR